MILITSIGLKILSSLHWLHRIFSKILRQTVFFFSQVRFGTNSIDRISRFGIDELSTSFKWTKLFLFRIEIKKNSKRLSERFFAHWIGNGFVFIFCVKRKKVNHRKFQLKNKTTLVTWEYFLISIYSNFEFFALVSLFRALFDTKIEFKSNETTAKIVFIWTKFREIC